MGVPDFTNTISSLSSEYLYVQGRLVSFEDDNSFCSILEKAHWEYIDEHRAKNSDLPDLSLKDFAREMLLENSKVQGYYQRVDEIFDAYQVHKDSIPSCGAAVLNERMDKVLLVSDCSDQNWWGFPKGKMEEGESHVETARREIQEEIGFDISPFLGENTPYYELEVKENKTHRIYFTRGIPEDTEFKTQTKKEISEIAWIRIRDLPNLFWHTSRKKLALQSVAPERRNVTKYVKFPRRTFAPFVRPLQEWIFRSRSKRPYHDFASHAFDSYGGRMNEGEQGHTQIKRSRSACVRRRQSFSNRPTDRQEMETRIPRRSCSKSFLESSRTGERILDWSACRTLAGRVQSFHV